MAINMAGINNPAYRHGHAQRSHGGYSREYHSWCNMRRRCYSPSNNRYYKYGALGIKVCDRWNPKQGRCFENFLRDLGECPEGMTLDRRDLKGNYEPSNCKWATDIEQANNKSNNRLIQDSQGVVWSLRRWCEMLGLNYKSCWYQIIQKGLDPKYILGEGFKHKEGMRYE